MPYCQSFSAMFCVWYYIRWVKIVESYFVFFHLTTLLKSHFGVRVFSCKFLAYFQNTFSKEHLWMVASDGLDAYLQILLKWEMKLDRLFTHILYKLSYCILIIWELFWKPVGIWSSHFLAVTTALNLSGLKIVLFSENYMIASCVSIIGKCSRPFISFQGLILTFFFSFHFVWCLFVLLIRLF